MAGLARAGAAMRRGYLVPDAFRVSPTVVKRKGWCYRGRSLAESALPLVEGAFAHLYRSMLLVTCLRHLTRNGEEGKESVRLRCGTRSENAKSTSLSFLY